MMYDRDPEDTDWFWWDTVFVCFCLLGLGGALALWVVKG